jgi:hypothetical protein
MQTLYRWRHCLRQRDVSQASTKTVFTQVVSTAPSSHQASHQVSTTTVIDHPKAHHVMVSCI